MTREANHVAPVDVALDELLKWMRWPRWRPMLEVAKVIRAF